MSFSNISTKEMARALDMLRGKINFILANHHSKQLMLEDESGHLAWSVENNCVTDILLGGMKARRSQQTRQKVLRRRLNPYLVKETQKIPHPMPYLEWLQVESVSEGETTGTDHPAETVTMGESDTKGMHKDTSFTENSTKGTARTKGVTQTSSHMDAYTDMWSDSTFIGTHSNESKQEAKRVLEVSGHPSSGSIVLPVMGVTEGSGSGLSNARGAVNGGAATRAYGNATSIQESLTNNDAYTVGHGRTFGENEAHTASKSATWPIKDGTSQSKSKTRTVTNTPVTLHDMLWTDDTKYFSPEEQMLRWEQMIRLLEPEMFWVKATCTAQLILSPYVEEPRITHRIRKLALAIVYGKSGYTALAGYVPALASVCSIGQSANPTPTVWKKKDAHA